MKIEIKLSPEDKIKYLGEGEWVYEPDVVEFTYKEYDCRIMRIMALEGFNNDHMFGGHLCGYIKISKDVKDDLVESLDVHGGITYDSVHEDGRWIGFDCAHSNDYLPSTEFIYKTRPEMIEARKQSKKMFESLGLDYENSIINQRLYRNVEFCVQECKNMVDQIIEKVK